jgi:hypothetical protein
LASTKNTEGKTNSSDTGRHSKQSDVLLFRNLLESNKISILKVVFKDYWFIMLKPIYRNLISYF